MLTREDFRKQQNWLTMAEIPLLLVIAFSVAAFFINAFSFVRNLSGALMALAFAAISLYLWRRMKERLWAARCSMVVTALLLCFGLLSLLVSIFAPGPNAVLIAALFIVAATLGLIGVSHHIRFLAASKNRTE